MSTKPDNIFIIIADSLRFDTLYSEPLPPYMKNNAVQYTNVRSSGPWTLPATASLFTGLLPHEHGATAQTRSIHKNIPTLAEELKKAGYQTTQITANIATTSVFGLHRGFDQILPIWNMVEPVFKTITRFLLLLGKPRVRKILLSRDDIVHQLSEDLKMGNCWFQNTYNDIFEQCQSIMAQNNKKNFFFINLMETHFPYHIDSRFRLETKGIIKNIKELATLFHTVNQTFLKKETGLPKPEYLELLKRRQSKSWKIIKNPVNDFIEKLHKNKNNLVIFASDHGDNFGDQNWLYHFSNVNEGGNRTPLFWFDNNHPKAKITDHPVSARFIYNSILKSAGIKTAGPVISDKDPVAYPLIESYWYNNMGKTLPQYLYNQFCFHNENTRFVLRNNQWLSAAVQKDILKPEETYKPLDSSVDPINEVKNKKWKNYLEEKVKTFKVFSESVKPMR